MSATTTAKIDGDSTGLVSALDKGGKAMEDVKADARKLSDQLKEVADDADKAAGALVQSVGGPGAIKAMAGIGAAVGIAKAGVEAFLDSSESLFRSYGEAGQKVWDETEKSLFAIKGAFAEAVLGGGTVEEMGKRLQSIFEGVKTVLDVLLLPVRELAKAFWELGDQSDKTAEKMKKIAKSQAEIDKAIVKNALRQGAEAYDTLIEKVDTLIGKEDTLKEKLFSRLDAEIEAEKNQIRSEAKNRALSQVLAEDAKFQASRTDIFLRELRKKALSEEEVERALEVRLADARSKFIKVRMDELRGANEYMSAEELKREQELNDKQYELFLKRHEKQNEVVRTGGGAPAAPAADNAPVVTEQQRADAMLEISKRLGKARADALAAANLQANINTALANDDAHTRELEHMRVHEENISAIKKKSAEERAAVDKAAYNEWVGQNAKQIGIAIGSGKKMADIARASIGNIVSALGDKAFAEAGLRYAGGDLVGAAAMTAAGVAAYATAGLLGATAKKSAAATPAAAGPAATPQNISYNLRVDAAFADGELVARQFARMQREAGRRGFAAGGAY